MGFLNFSQTHQTILHIHLPSQKTNYTFIDFGVALKMDNINVFFIFIQVDINHKYKLHM